MTLREVLAPFVLTRALLIGIAVLAAISIPYGVACRPCDLSEVPVLNALGRWDAEAYVRIAREGYVPAASASEHSTAAFTPLLPLLMRGLAAVAGRSDDDALLAAGILATNAALLVGLVFLVRLGRMELDARDAGSARRAALYLLVFPTSILLSAAYAESLFLAFGVASLVEARAGRWWLAGALGALAALSRVFGLALVVPLAVERVLQHRQGRRVGIDVLAVIAPLLGFAGWQAYVVSVGGPLYLEAETAFGRRAAAPWDALTGLFDPAQYGQPWIVLTTLVLMTVLVALSWRVLHPTTAACGTALLLAAASSGTLTSFPRYALAMFPAFLVLGWLGRHRAIHVAYLALATLLAVVLTAMWAAWYWIG